MFAKLIENKVKCLLGTCESKGRDFQFDSVGSRKQVNVVEQGNGRITSTL